MQRYYLALTLFATLLFSNNGFLLGYRLPRTATIIRRVPSEQASWQALAGATLTVVGLAVLIDYLYSESDAEKAARLNAIAALSPAEREIYYQEKQLELERQKINSLIYHTSMWAASTPEYIEEIIFY